MQSRPSVLERSQKKLYLAVKKELALYERGKARELLAYERSFRSTLPRRVRASDRHALLQAISAANVVLVGDFHPFRQSQKGFIRLVEGAAAGTRRPVLALECFLQAHQAALNEFLSGLITAEELRDKVDFERYWPFPWENYRDILELARRSRIPVLALNILGRGRKKSPLRERDEAAAERVARELGRFSDATVFVLYGELHLGHEHLPAAIRAKAGKHARVLLVHQNLTEQYWKAPTPRDGQKPEVLHLGPREYCILNSVPWVKLRSYLDWLEGGSSPDLEGELDVAGMVHHYARLLAETAGLAAPIDDSAEILPPDRLGSRGLPRAYANLPYPDREIARHALAFHRTGYLPGRDAILLPTVSTNSLSEAATHLLRHSLRRVRPSRTRWTAEEWMAHFMLGYLGSKVLNPKRKCNEVADLGLLASLPSRGKKLLQARSEVAARALALLRPYLPAERISSHKARLSGSREVEACRAAGFALGERYFIALLRRPALLRGFTKMLQRPPSRATVREAAAAARRVTPGSGSSKRERF